MDQKNLKTALGGGASRFKLIFIALALALLASFAVLATNVVANADDEKAQEAAQDAEVLDGTTLREEMYRIYNPWTGEHLYTSNVDERDSNVALGWRDEGIEWIAPKQTKSTSYKPVYRLYNPFVSGGDHHYTTNESEYNSLPADGWKQEGVAWYSADENESGAVKLLRQYNPYSETGTHNYTKNQKEQDNLIKAGWRAEGIGWYGYDSLYVSIANMKATVSTVGATYTGKQLTPAVTISGLTAGTDFTVSYGTNINAGKNAGTATVKGKGAYTGTLTVKFDIQKADPNPTLPQGLTGIQSDALSTVALPSVSSGTFAWKAPATTMAKQGQQKFPATFTPKDTKNYNTVTKDVSVYVKGLYTVTFNTGEGSKVEAQQVVEGEKASQPAEPTRDGYKLEGWYSDAACTKAFDFVKTAIKANTTLYAKWSPKVTIDTQDHGYSVNEKVADEQGKVNDPTSEAGTQSGLEIEGWYNNSACKVDESKDLKKWDFDNDTVDKPMTLYANWVPSEEGDMTSYWIAPASKCTTSNTEDAKINAANDNYYKDAWNVKKSSEEIESDVEVLLAGESADNPTYADVLKQYTEFMTNDDYHLYTIWNGDTTDASGSKQAANGYVEFRILEVGSHNGDAEGASALTFQATHLLPQATKMNSSSTNKDGWKGSGLEASLNSGDIYTKFSQGLLETCIAQVKKTSTKGEGSTDVWSDADLSANKFWIPSRVEVSGTGLDGYRDEGKQYTYYANLVINDNSTSETEVDKINKALQMTTRAGNYAKTTTSSGRSGNWWLRSPNAVSGSDKYFRMLNDEGNFNAGSPDATSENGVAPAFCLGGRLVKFDTNGHGNAISSQMLGDDDKTAKEPTEDERGTEAGLTFEGWYTNAACSGDKFDFATEITAPMTLYANWVPSTEDGGDSTKYWLAPSSIVTTGNTSTTANQTNNAADKNNVRDSYVKEEWNVKKSSAEIQADVAKIQEGDAATIAEYKSYMNSDKFHLYTAWNGSTADASGESTANKYVEFRIIQVGANGNNEALTFQATHELPEAMKLYDTQDSKMSLPWEKTNLYTGFNNASGSIISNFNEAFRGDLQTVTKSSNMGVLSERQNSQNKMWIASRYEISGANFCIYNKDNQYRADGNNQYEWFKNMGISDLAIDKSSALNPALERASRAGNSPKGYDNSTYTSGKAGLWYVRSAADPLYDTAYKISTGHLTYDNYYKNDTAAVFWDGCMGAQSDWYWLDKYGVVPCFSFGGNLVKFDNQGHGNDVASQAILSGNKATQPTEDQVGTEAGLTFEGWYTDAKCSKPFDFSTAITTQTTLYANWVPSTEDGGDATKYWLAPSVTTTTSTAAATANANYVQDSWNVKKSSAEIEADVAKIKAGDKATIAEYTEYMNNDTFHLYTKWNGGKGGDTTGKNLLAEFRIIGVGDHDGDGSGLTFQAVHVLPVAYQLNETASTKLTWGESSLYTALQADGGIFKKFETSLTDKIISVEKKTTKGGGTSEEPVYTTATSNNKFWIASRVEMSGAEKATDYKVEGVQYDYYAKITVGDDATAKNVNIVKATRAGANPTSDVGTPEAGVWWMRTPNVEAGAKFLAADANGCVNNSFTSTAYAGIVPCFCF